MPQQMLQAQLPPVFFPPPPPPPLESMGEFVPRPPGNSSSTPRPSNTSKSRPSTPATQVPPNFSFGTGMSSPASNDASATFGSFDDFIKKGIESLTGHVSPSGP